MSRAIIPPRIATGTMKLVIFSINFSFLQKFRYKIMKIRIEQRWKGSAPASRTPPSRFPSESLNSSIWVNILHSSLAMHIPEAINVDVLKENLN